MTRFRINLLLTGLTGLLVCLLFGGTSAWLTSSGIVKPLLPYLAPTMLLVLVFGGFSLAEIPVMLFAMRRLLAERPDNRGVVLGLNTLYVAFAAIYGAPVLLFSGSIGWGVALCGLGIVRFVTSLLWVREPPP